MITYGDTTMFSLTYLPQGKQEDNLIQAHPEWDMGFT